MSGDLAIQIGREALTMVMLIAAPMLGLGLLVGILVSIFQATTQIQEQTLVFIPKIIAIFIAILVFGPWMLSLMVDYTREIFINLPNLVR
ncbi:MULTISPECIES: flagellar biosynthesis protein FliQ [Pelosinus]|uniref:Flagellar biosynthetic protein FliQ n=1 Tax=Pelosinus fermentans B4 TaxID=1149862 RepID=I9LCM6_9FIRM|nr:MULTISPECIES: flagellar biosynthesis protein FliQ [Pelosinus]EIW18199.1 flagellar biosynthetic protein FliQ [Pelosinus fermentans B4]EIW24003.1 flagellar biosynthetic protein FliQ [Pelosinus fermentans A11]OAM94069.1 flagellar biosynthetic protein FliQ [Pelosinus fermentans DSM 17108]SDQ98897.1 flagellar biosynthetic protein FliQ [Pelosinus fermentans]